MRRILVIGFIVAAFILILLIPLYLPFISNIFRGQERTVTATERGSFIEIPPETAITATRFEKIEVQSVYVSQANPYHIVLIARNTGPSDTIIDEIFVNGKPISVEGVLVNGSNNLVFSLPSGAKGVFDIELPLSFVSGQTVEVMLHTAAGNRFSVTVFLS